jgi:ABC-2 type transport system ATP-binding protein
MAMLETTNLRKTYRDFSLGPVYLVLEPGTVHALIGANGAGKSTLFRCLMGLVRCNQGIIRINGHTVENKDGTWTESIGYIGDYFPLFEHWSGARNLEAFSGFYSQYSEARVQVLASRLDLDLDQIARTYSTGQRTKLAIIHALSHNAPLLLLDEPTAGLDPMARDTLMDILYDEMHREDLTLLYATHYVSEIEQLADTLLFMDKGRILARKEKDELSQFWRRITFSFNRPFGELPGQVKIRSEGQHHEIISNNHESTLVFLNSLGAQSVQCSLLTMEQICVQVLRQHAGK